MPEIYVKLSDLEKLTRSKFNADLNLMVVDPDGQYIYRRAIYWIEHYTVQNPKLLK